jgi:cytochrome c oxidase subunit III
MSRSIDVSELPENAFGHRSLPWWGTLGFVVVEGTTLAVAVASLLYVRRNFPDWPPGALPAPDLLVPTLGLLVMLAGIIPMRRAAKAADHVDPAGVTTALGLAVLITTLMLIIRIFEFRALNVRWDDTVYGSVVWLAVGLHTVLLVADLLETATFLAIFRLRKMEPKHYPDVEDAAFYQYFLSGVWVPLYLLVFLGPRFM